MENKIDLSFEPFWLSVIRAAIDYFRHQFIHLVTLVVLITIAAYRHEMSCNSVYIDHEHAMYQDFGSVETASARCRRHKRKKQRGLQINSRNYGRESILNPVDDFRLDHFFDKMGHIYSGGPFLAIALAVWSHLFFSEINEDGSIQNQASKKDVVTQEIVVSRKDDIDSKFESNSRQNIRDDDDHHHYPLRQNLPEQINFEERKEMPTDIKTNLSPTTEKQAIQTVAWNAAKQWVSSTTGCHVVTSNSAAPMVNNNDKKTYGFKFLDLIPDTQIHVLSFLHPRDVIHLSCTSHLARMSFDDSKERSSSKNNLATMIWWMMWKRDYACLITDWKIGTHAALRSFSNTTNCPPTVKNMLVDTFNNGNIIEHDQNKNHDSSMSMKTFYFLFSQSWLEYVIAGHASTSCCLMGLHGHVLDITNFLSSHPGSPETLLIQGGGQDATSFFESVGHSLIARRLAQSDMIVAVDMACVNIDSNENGEEILMQNWGVLSQPKIQDHPKGEKVKLGTIPMIRSKRRRPGSLQEIKNQLTKGKQNAHSNVTKFLNDLNSQGNDLDILGNVQTYFDPFCGTWKYWYLTSNLSVTHLTKL